MMSYHPTRTNFVRPHAKTSYIRPLCGLNENDSALKESCGTPQKYADSPPKAPGSEGKQRQLKSVIDAKERHVQNLNSAYSKLYDEMDKFVKWRSAIEVECKQKNKKIDEMTQVVESQRKVIVNMEKQCENLSLQLNEEIQNRVSVMEKFCFTKELCSTLRKKFNDLQEQFNDCKKTKETIKTCCKENTETIEHLKNKFNTLCVDYSEKVAFLGEALKHEKHNNLVLKDVCQQQNANAEEQNKSFNKFMAKYEEELKQYSADLVMERSKSSNLEEEKSKMQEKILYLGNSIEDNLKILKTTEEQLKLTLEREIEIKKSFECETLKVDKLTRKCDELELLKNKQTTEFEDLKTAFSSLEKALFETKENLELTRSANEKISNTLRVVEEEKGCLKIEISNLKDELKALENKLLNDTKVFDELKNEMSKEKDELHSSLKLSEDKLQNILTEKDNLSKLYSESKEELLALTNDYKVSVSKIESLSLIEEKYYETLKKVEEMRAVIEEKSKCLDSNALQLKEMNDLKLKYDENLIEVKDLKELVQSKSQELELKALQLNEMNDLKLKYDENLIEVKDLKELVESKSEQLELKEENIKSLKVIEEQHTVNLEKVKYLELNNQKLLEDLNKKEKKLLDVNTLMKEKQQKIAVLEYENVEIKDILRSERESVKVCLECELMKEKLNELDELKIKLMDTETEMARQKQVASNTMKLLGETEDSYDKVRIRKENELVKCKDTIQSLQHQLRMLKVEVAESEKLKAAKEKLEMDVEELKLQNERELKRLEFEKEQLRNEIDALKSKKNLFLDIGSKTFENCVPKTKFQKSPFLLKSKDGGKMESNSSVNEATVLKEAIRPVISNYKKFCQEVKSKDTTIQNQSTPVKEKEKKRAWDNDSSGSECLEVVFDNSEKLVGCTPKRKFSEFKRTPVSIVSPRLSMMEKQKSTAQDNEIPSSNQSTVISFTSKPAVGDSENDAFLSSGSLKKSNLQDSPWNKRSLASTPSTPGQRKFFKTPLKEREFPFKKPQSQKWF